MEGEKALLQISDDEPAVVVGEKIAFFISGDAVELIAGGVGEGFEERVKGGMRGEVQVAVSLSHRNFGSATGLLGYWTVARRRASWSRPASRQRASTARLWSSRWVRPETVTAPTMPALATMMGKQPP